MESLILLTVLTIVFSALYIRIVRKDYRELYSSHLDLRMENIELGDEVRKYKQIASTTESKYNHLTQLTLTQIEVLNESNGIKKQTVN